MWISSRELGLKESKGKLVEPPTIKQCPVALEAEVKDIERYGDHYLVTGEVLNTRVKEKDFKPLLHISGNRFAEGEEFKA